MGLRFSRTAAEDTPTAPTGTTTIPEEAPTAAEIVDDSTITTPIEPFILVNGLSVGLVRYADGVFRQIAPGNLWVQDAQVQKPKKSTFRYIEKSRTEDAVLLHDESRDLNVMIHVSSARIRVAQASSDFEDKHRITDATIASNESMFNITGLTVGLVKYASGVFRRTGAGDTWVEDTADPEPKKNTFRFKEVSRSVDSVVLHDETRGSTVVLDVYANRIRLEHGPGDFRDLYSITEIGIVEPLGVILTKIVVVSEDDGGGNTEEVYGHLYTKALGEHVAPDSAKNRDLYQSSRALAIDEGKAHHFIGHEALFYGLDPRDEIWVGGWLKEDDIFVDDDLGSQHVTVRVGDVEDRDVSLRYADGDTIVEVHFHITKNYFNYGGRDDGFLPVRAHRGLQYIPRFPGIVPIRNATPVSLSDGVNVFPEGPKSASNGLRTVIIFSLGYVPHVGSLLSHVVGWLWPDGKMDVWDEIKERAESMMKNLIRSERVGDLERRMTGLKDTIESYENTSMGSPEKGSWMVNILGSLNEIQPFFFDERYPEEMLPYLVTLGTLMLVVMREQTLFYKEIYGVQDPDVAYKNEELKERVEEYQSAVQRAIDGAINWRTNLVEIEDVDDDYVVTDDFNGYRSRRMRNRPEALLRNMQEAAKNDFKRLVEEIAEPAAMWKYMLPGNKDMKPTRKLIHAKSGPFPVERWDPFEENVDGERITSILIESGDLVDGLQLWYGGKPGPAHGKPPLDVEHRRLDLDDDEVIIAVSGLSGDFVDSIWFFTSKGRTFGGGRLDKGSYEWTAAPPSADGYLESIFGTTGGFGFKWRDYKVE